MLNERLYHIQDLSTDESQIKASIMLNSSNSIFKGHYPDQPILPGACMLQILKELLELAMKKKFILRKAVQLKFLTIIAPDDKPLLFTINYQKQEGEALSVTATLSSQESVAFKFQGSFT